MFEYKNEVIDMSGILKSKLSGNDMITLDDMINKRAAEGWELISSSYFVGVPVQVLLTYKREKYPARN